MRYTRPSRSTSLLPYSIHGVAREEYGANRFWVDQGLPRIVADTFDGTILTESGVRLSPVSVLMMIAVVVENSESSAQAS